MEPISQLLMDADPDIRAALERAGWSQSRSIDISPWVEILETAGFEINASASLIWQELGGLDIKSSSRREPRSSLRIDPVDACIDAAGEAARLGRKYGEVHSPLGLWSLQYRTYVGSGGRVIAVGPGGEWKLGDNIMEALTFVIIGGSDIHFI